MTRSSKQSRRRAVSFRRPKPTGIKSGPKRDQLTYGYRIHENAVPEAAASSRFFPKMS